MKICYIWIEKFRNFENFGFNISSFRKFSYDYISGNISVKKTTALPDDFYGSQISDVAGLIGKNGAGKSNAVELLCKIIKGGKSSIKNDFLIIYENSGELVCEYSFDENRTPQSKHKIYFLKYEGNINPLKVVFFSNVFDERRNGFDKEISDISVNYRFKKGFSLIMRQELTDFEKQINFIGSKVFPFLNIGLPSHIQITSKIWSSRLNSAAYTSLYGDKLYKTISSFKAKFRSRLREIKPDYKFIHILRYSFFFEKIHEIFRDARHSDIRIHEGIRNRLHDFLLSLFTNVRTEGITEALLYFIEQIHIDLETESQASISNKRDYKRFAQQLSFLRNLNSNDLEFNYDNEGTGNKNFEYFSFEFTSSNENNFVKSYASLFAELNLLEINWLGISSGQKAYLNLFASLYQELRHTKHESLLLCIDEGDLYLHPKWQVEFFDKLLSTLPLIYFGKIQLVLTSHSPFMLSDLPRQSITVLDNSYKNSSLDGIQLKMNTFGGNLYDLYAEPFFLGNIRTSDFAHNKILSVISEIEKGQITAEGKKRIQKTINVLGDEVIRYKLNKLLND